MNGKLYLFGIGGTGSRVIKSLIMLAASSVKINADTIVPIIVDPDFANADVTRTIEQIKTYIAIRNKLSYNDCTKNKFFNVAIENITKDFRLTLQDTKDKKFSEFIKFDTLSQENKALASMLFSKKNLEADMEIGFKGNPNIGSIVLNQFTDSQDFMDFTAAFKPGDRIFIISSIFGGTGASGFPLLLKNIRGLDNNMPNSDAIKKAPIGAITVLPYFNVKPSPESTIDSSTFIGKTKAALQYYEKNVNGDKSSVNVLYYIGDERTKQYENEEGGIGQKNNAHIIELASALAIIDFACMADNDPALVCNTDKNTKVYAKNPEFKEFGIKDDVKDILFGNLTQITSDIICTPLTQFALLSKYMNEHIKKASSQPWLRDNKFDDAFMKSYFVKNLQNIVASYIEWLLEMADNDRSFKPFNMAVKENDLFSIINGIKPSSIKSLWAFLKSGFDLFDADLNKTHISKNFSQEQKFIELFYNVTQELVKKKFKF